MNALGRGQDAQSLTQFITTIAQTMGPEAIMKYIDPGEYVKRLAAAQGIDVLNLVKTQEQVQGEMQQQQENKHSNPSWIKLVSSQAHLWQIPQRINN